MWKIVRVIGVLAVVALMTLTAAFPAAADQTDRPFKGVLVGAGNVVLDASCPGGLRTETWATGWVAHLGLTTMTGHHCTPAIGENNIQGGVETWVAANGDTLETTYAATVEPFEPVEGAVMTGPGHTVITGGTGRFAGATGEFNADFRGIVHFTAPMELSWSYEGAISY